MMSVDKKKKRKILSQEITLAVAVAVAGIVEHLALRVEKII